MIASGPPNAFVNRLALVLGVAVEDDFESTCGDLTAGPD